MDEGKQDEDVYTETGRHKLVEDGELDPAEEGFMEGAEGLGEDATCKQCKKVLGQDIEREKVVAREINGKKEFFCSNECADKYEKENP